MPEIPRFLLNGLKYQMKMRIRRYRPDADEKLWNGFCTEGKNQTFLFNRNFMDYHKDRFDDFSLIIEDDQGKPQALLPANISRNSPALVVSHEGLTYGGLIVKPEVRLESVISAFYLILKFLKESGVDDFHLKHFPSFYNLRPSDEIEYVLFLAGANLYRRDVALVVEMENRINCSGNIRREGNKAEKSGAVIVESADMRAFWTEILVPNLNMRFGVNPVHTLEEITRLKGIFPNHIRQFNVLLNGNIVAGTTLFIDNGVAHCQYISSNEEGRKSGALNFLFRNLIESTFADLRYFDFGIVNEDSGRVINKGMLFWKESFGGRSLKHDFYSLSTDSYKKLEVYL